MKGKRDYAILALWSGVPCEEESWRVLIEDGAETVSLDIVQAAHASLVIGQA